MILVKKGEIIAYKIPWNYVVEIVCDFIAAGKTYKKEKWTQHQPLDYHNKLKKQRHFHKDTLELLETFLKIIDEQGVDSFIKIVKSGRGYLFLDYNEQYAP